MRTRELTFAMLASLAGFEAQADLAASQRNDQGINGRKTRGDAHNDDPCPRREYGPGAREC
jgi:hypothetical protein